jgi:hypothetical protein
LPLPATVQVQPSPADIEPLPASLVRRRHAMARQPRRGAPGTHDVDPQGQGESRDDGQPQHRQ